jgi:prophage regulatory protein
MSLEEVVYFAGLSRSSIRRLERAGSFPARIKLSPKRVGWLKSEVDLWVTWRSKEGRQR